MARGGARPGAARPAGKSANTSPPVTRARARARDGSGNQRPWPADKVERWPIDRLIPYAKNAARQRRSSGLHQGWHHRQGAVVPMAQTLAALHPDRTKRPRPHRPALVATPGASEWISRVSSPATNKSGRTLKKGAGNLANSRAAWQISLMIR